MQSKSVAVISASGFLGQKVAGLFKSRGYDVKETAFPRNPGQEGIELDVTEQSKVAAFVKRFSPNAVVNCSAITSVDWCEEHSKECFDVNLNGAKNLAMACKTAKAKMVHFSTGFVFDGRKGSPYIESDEMNPLNVYSRSKVESEKAIAETLKDFLIIRTIDLYGLNNKNDKNFVTWVLQNLKAGKQFGVVNDQFSQPTLVDDVASAAWQLLQLDKRGVFHVAGPEYLSKYEFALRIAGMFGLDKKLIKPISTAESPLKAKRPMTLQMSCEKAAKLGIRARNIGEGLSLLKKQMQPPGAP